MGGGGGQFLVLYFLDLIRLCGVNLLEIIFS